MSKLPKRIRHALTIAADRFQRWTTGLYPEHDWIRDCGNLSFCRVCWLPETHDDGFPCPDEPRVLARRPEWRPPHPAPDVICPHHPGWRPGDGPMPPGEHPSEYRSAS